MDGALDSAAIRAILPSHFLEPTRVVLSSVGGLERSQLRDSDWAGAWRLIGEASEFVLALLEEHQNSPTPEQIIRLECSPFRLLTVGT
jgi:hypothetical protein